MKSRIEIKNLSFKYDKDIILKALSYKVTEGGFISILGPNGSGKTTLLKNLCGLLNFHEGQVVIDDKDLKAYKHKELAQKVAVVHQTFNTDFDFPVEDVVLMGRYPYLSKFQGESQKDIAIADLAMSLTATSHLKDKSLKEMSGGERQRVMIARALTQEPDILMLDEPISHLDIKYQLEILKLCQKLNIEKGLTIVTTLHDINLAIRFSDEIVLMKDGRIIEYGPPEKVITESNIKAVYDIDVEVRFNDMSGIPLIIPKV